MKVFKISISFFIIISFSIDTTYAQIKSEALETGAYFKGSKSFAEIVKYNIAHPIKKGATKMPANPAFVKESIVEGNKRVGVMAENITEQKIVNKTNGNFKNIARQPEAVNSCVGFESTESNLTSFPPDVHGAVGFDHLVTTLNTEVRIQNKFGNNLSTVILENFFSTTGETDCFDPRIMFDQLSNRFFFMACVARRSATSGFVIAASQTPDPTGNWNFYKVDADPADTLWFDYGNMGFSNDKICISGNMFNNISGGLSDGGRLFTISKSNLINGAAIGTVTLSRGMAFNTCPVLTFSNTGTCYAVAVQNSATAQLVLYSVTGTATSPTVTTNGTVNYGSGNGWNSGLGDTLPQSGTTRKINAGDDRIQSAVFRNGKIFWANNFYWPLVNPTYCGVQYGSFTASTRATLNFAGLWNATGDEMFCFPNLAVNNDEDVAVAFSYFSKTGFPSAGVAYGTNNLVLTYNLTALGGQKYLNYVDNSGRLRWGDYMSASVDPTDDKSMWTLSEYSKADASQYRWSTWWSKVCPNTCTADFNLRLNLPANSVKKYEATNSITSTAIINNSSFVKYDAGSFITLSPGFVATQGSNYKAFIEGCGGNE
jgi:hypothetical protein